MYTSICKNMEIFVFFRPFLRNFCGIPLSVWLARHPIPRIIGSLIYYEKKTKTKLHERRLFKESFARNFMHDLYTR